MDVTEMQNVLIFLSLVVIVALILVVLVIVLRLMTKRQAAKRQARLEAVGKLERQWKQELLRQFRAIEKQLDEQLALHREEPAFVKRPQGKLVLAPGASIDTFLSLITEELSRKRTEWFIVALLDQSRRPQYMVEIKGRATWVIFDLDDLFRKASQVDAARILLVHNHPTSAVVGPSLIPSEQDIISGYAFYLHCVRRGFDFEGDFIVSGNLYREFLMPLIARAKEAEEEERQVEHPIGPAFEIADEQAESAQEYDPLLSQAVALLMRHERASASFLQRRLGIGYPRAARLIEQLEEAGIVGPMKSGGRSRKVLVKENSPQDI